MSETSWEWDATLFAGSAAYYARGRTPYPTEIAAALADALALDGTGRLLDVGCGPGTLTLMLADRFEQAVGVDADQDMIAEASRSGARNVEWRCLRAEELPAGLGEFRLITFAQSFHWMDRARVAATARAMLTPDGACVHVHATTHRGIAGDVPYDEIDALVRSFLGPVRRAGQSLLPNGTRGGENEFYRAAGFQGPQRLEFPGPDVVRDPDDIVAAVFSTSSAAPHLFGERVQEFAAALRELLGDRVFHERFVDVALDVWRP
ncbi:MAG TPA: class I SAM-dependent methyltransferase [Kutzneria sp.]